jgi:hypothetical protein
MSTCASHPDAPTAGGPFSVSTTGDGDTHPCAVCIGHSRSVARSS